MAIDGVAPRAKMNQQRGRRYMRLYLIMRHFIYLISIFRMQFLSRFRSAKEAADREKEVLRRGEKLPEADRFDSNCITPGTSFMARLQAHLKYFVSLKVSTDKMWQKVKIILSGHDVSDFLLFLNASEKFYGLNVFHFLVSRRG